MGIGARQYPESCTFHFCWAGIESSLLGGPIQKSTPDSEGHQITDCLESNPTIMLGVLMFQIIARKLIARGAPGAIVNVSSQASHRALSDHTIYCEYNCKVSAPPSPYLPSQERSGGNCSHLTDCTVNFGSSHTYSGPS